MRTTGIDMAASERSTAACVVSWSGGEARVVEVRRRCSDADLVEVVTGCGGADRVGVDVPFGWPRGFARAVAAHAAGEAWPWRGGVSGDVRREHLRLRLTDRVAARRLGRAPLTAAFDRLGAATARWAHVADELAARGVPVARDGSGAVVEVYPAGARRVWALGGERSVAEIRAALPVRVGRGDEALLRDEHVFDAFVAALVARAVQVGLATGPSPEEADLAREEGWLWLPEDGSLPELGRAAP